MAETRKKVLVVDDDPHIVELLVMVLQDAGYDVVSANNGSEAIRIAVTTRPDVIVLDIIMPGLDGWEVADRLVSHGETAGIPIIFLTARTRAEDQLRGWFAGCFDYLTKPFEVDYLLNRIRVATTHPSDAIQRLTEELRREKIAELQTESQELDLTNETPELGKPTA